MSGLEVAGVALAVLPLLISTAKHYDSALRPFARYRHYEKEAKTYAKELRVQRAIFRRECQNLLVDTAVVDLRNVDVVLSSSSSDEWPSKELDVQLDMQLGESRQDILDAVQLIEEHLHNVDADNLRLSAKLDEEEQKDYRLDTKVQSKLRMSFSESKLDRNIAILKARNDNLRTLCAQTRSSSSNHPQVISQKAPVDLRSYAIIRKAARALHEALSSACTKHTEHLAHFRVEIEEVMIKNDTCPKVKFSLGFTHLTLAKADRSHDSLWFIVDTAINEHTATPVDEVKSKDHELDEILQRQLNIGACSPSQQVKKAVRFGSSIDAPTPHPGLMAKNAFIQEGGMPRDLCDNLHRLLSEPCDIKICVGVFGNIGQFKHFVYPSSCTRKSKSRSAVTLSQLIRRPSTVDPIQYLATDDRIGLARRLATAVLQYHTTPWLKPSWRSDDVVFFDDSGSDQLQPNLFAPYLNTKFSESSDHPSSGTSFTDMVRNPLLFSLGVVLLEIAHGVSLNALRQPIDLQNGGDRFQDLLTAQRLAKSRGSIMGSKYHAIVEHCIFPPGDDLNDVRLQGAFHQSVVKPLREIEAGFKELYLDD